MSTDENYLQWGLWQKKADRLAEENRRLRGELEQLTKAIPWSVVGIAELPQAVRVALSSAAMFFVRRWTQDCGIVMTNAADKAMRAELVQLLVNVFNMPERGQ